MYVSITLIQHMTPSTRILTPFLGTLVRTVTCTLAEITVGICCVSVPTIRPLLTKLAASSRLAPLRKLFPASVSFTFCKNPEQSEQTMRQEAFAMGYKPEKTSQTVLGDDEENQPGFEEKVGREMVMPKSWITSTDETDTTLVSGTSNASRTSTASGTRSVSLGCVRNPGTPGTPGTRVMWNGEEGGIWAGPPPPTRFSVG
jgi:hypothetical protein